MSARLLRVGRRPDHEPGPPVNNDRWVSDLVMTQTAEISASTIDVMF